MILADAKITFAAATMLRRGGMLGGKLGHTSEPAQHIVEAQMSRRRSLRQVRKRSREK